MKQLKSQDSNKNKSNSSKLLLTILIIILCALSFSYGFVAFWQEWFPYNLALTVYDSVREVQQDTYSGNINDHITINSPADIDERREQLIRYIWKSDSLPEFSSVNVEKNIVDSRYESLSADIQIDKLTYTMDYDVNSIMYYFHSQSGISGINSKDLFIYHEGHDGDFKLRKYVIESLLDEGYDVIAIAMPLVGMNNRAVINVEPFGDLTFTVHDQFRLLDSDNFSSMKFFVEPVFAAVDYAKSLGYDNVYMTGISGGGWTTVMSAALDPRIDRSYPVAGSYPMFLRSRNYGEPYGDYEQTNPYVYKIADYLDLYIMGSYGKEGSDRAQVQLQNVNDPCCFSGEKYNYYLTAVQNKLNDLGSGSFNAIGDDTHHEHKYSDKTLSLVLADVKSSSR